MLPKKRVTLIVIVMETGANVNVDIATSCKVCDYSLLTSTCVLADSRSSRIRQYCQNSTSHDRSLCTKYGHGDIIIYI